MNDRTAVLYGYAFGDETGEAGLRFGRGSSVFFVAGLVLTNQPDQLREYVADFQQELRLKASGEISFHRSPDRNRSAFLAGLLAYDIAIRALVIDKISLSSELKKLSRTDFYIWAFGDLLSHTLAELEAATIVLDEFGKQATIVRALKHALRQTFSDVTLRQHVRQIRTRRSHSEPLLQIADMVTGAIYRFVATGDDRFYQIIQARARILRM
jgi:hypothetical protein